jgi:hypothetical protein
LLVFYFFVCLKRKKRTTNVELSRVWTLALR